MKAVTAEQMTFIDRKTIEYFGITSSALMERAGVAVARYIRQHYALRKTIVLAGTGNNGGDGLVVARELANAGHKVQCIVVGRKQSLSEDCARQLRTALAMGLDVTVRATVQPGRLSSFHGTVVVDALFGTGLSRPVKGAALKVIQQINASRQPVVSVDIPSGVSADTGQVLGEAVQASATVTFGAPKRGHFLHPGAGLAGELIVEDIGFPPVLFEEISCDLLQRDNAAALLPRRRADAHKGMFGHVLIVAGSRGKTGAALMAARAALRSGAGLVTVACPESLLHDLQGGVLEEMVLALPDDGTGRLSARALSRILLFLESSATVAAIGPGIGVSPDITELISELIRQSHRPLVLDADALNAIAASPAVLREASAEVIITPHPGELSRLSACTVKDIETDRMGHALSFAQEHGVTLIAKGAPTLICTRAGEILINTSGNAGLAKGGSGDVLTGMTAAWLAQGLSPRDAAALSVYSHGLSADLALQGRTVHSIMASDVLTALPAALSHLGGSTK